jgi:ankyrin repeat protein
MDFFINLRGIGVNAKDENGRTCLHYACETEFQGIIDYLIKNGADVNS